MDLGEVLELVADTPVIEVGPGDRVLVENERSSTLFVLIDGAFEVRRGGQFVAQIADAGAIIGELGLLLGTPASADVVATTPTRVHRIDDGDQLLRSNPEFVRLVATMLAERLWQASTYLSDLQAQFAGGSQTLGLVPTVLSELLNSSPPDLDPGSDREAESPY